MNKACMMQTKRTPAIVNDIAPGSEAMKKDVEKFVTDYKVWTDSCRVNK